MRWSRRPSRSSASSTGLHGRVGRGFFGAPLAASSRIALAIDWSEALRLASTSRSRGEAPGTVKVKEVPGAISQGRSIAQARARIREVLALFLDVDEKDVELREDLRLGPQVQRAIDTYRQRREIADREADAASAAYRTAVRTVLDAGLSTRDAGEALGVSQARIAQLASSSPIETKKTQTRSRMRLKRAV